MILVTGCAGFIGFHISKYLLKKNENVFGVDNLCSDYNYDPQFKYDRLEILKRYTNFTFYQMDINDEGLQTMFAENDLDYIVHLAAHGSIPDSFNRSTQYTLDNILGHVKILEIARKQRNLRQMVYATTSAVYGKSEKIPFKENEVANDTISMYGATKLCDEVISETYHNFYGIPMTGLRYFTAYGTWTRPDMATYKFADAIVNGKPLTLYNSGKMWRDFAYIDDIVEGSIMAMYSGNKSHKIYNIGYNETIELTEFVKIMEDILEKKANIVNEPMQPGDLLITRADVSLIEKELGFKPKTNVRRGLEKFAPWFLEYNKKINKR